MLSRTRNAAAKIASTLRFGLGVRRFVKERLTVEEARQIVAERIARREERFVSLVERAILNNPRSAYRKMLAGPGLAARSGGSRSAGTRLQMAYVIGALRLAGGTTLRPQFVPPTDVAPIVRWLAERKGEGETCALHGYASSCVRVCVAAQEMGLDVSGTRFCLAGEPVTQAKHDAVRAVGGVPIVSYAMAETGQLGNSCRYSQSPDDMHFFTDSFALIQHTRAVGPQGEPVRPFLITSLLPGSSKILLNVEIDDCGELSERPCDCLWGRMGLTRRVSHLRSFVKLTTEGMTFLGTNLIHVIERELPERFGGGPSDYQLLEEEDAEGRGRLSLRVSPRIGPVDEQAVVAFLYERIRAGGGANRLFGHVWREAQSIRVARQEPKATASGKIFPFHTLR